MRVSSSVREDRVGGRRPALQRDRAELRLGLPVLVRDVRDVADDEDAGEAGDGEVRLDIDPAATTLGEPGGACDRRGHQPAAPDDATGLDRRAVRQRHVTGADRFHAGPEQEFDAVLLEDPRRVRVALVGEHLEELLPVVDEVDLRPGRQRRELVDHRRVDHLGQRPGDLDPGRPATDDDEVEGALVDEMWIAVGLLERLDDPRLEAVGVVERIQREGVLRPWRPEEVRLGAGRQHEVIPRVGLAVTRRHGPGRGVDRNDLGALGLEPVELGRDLAQRIGDVTARPTSTSRPGRGAAGTGGSRSCR